jgi:hypothetical protein
MRALVCSAACLAIGVGLFAQPASTPEILNREMKPMNVEGRTLPETVKLLEYASGVPVRLAAELEACAASDRPGCDWRITTAWGTGRKTLESALDTLCRSSRLTYRVVDGAVVLTQRPRPPR